MDLGSMADWVSGIGSLSAVVTALYLSHSSQKIRLSGTCGHRLLVGGGDPPLHLFAISATNIGTRSTVITSIGLQTGFFRKKFATLVINQDTWSAGIPKSLSDGETAHWSLPLYTDRPWLERLFSDFVLTRSDIASFRVKLYPSNGKPVTLNPGRAFRQMMREAMDKTRASTRSKQA